MSLNSVSGKSVFYEKMNAKSGKNQKSPENAKDGFSENLKELSVQEQEETGKNQERLQENKTTVRMDYCYGKAATEILLQRSGHINMNAVLECGVRHISYSESDSVKVFAVEGYTLKAQVQADAHKVYVEQKNEDGTYTAYEVNPLKVPEDTQDPIEQIAAEAWENAKKMFNNGVFTEIDAEEPSEEMDIYSFEEMIADFHEFVKKRIKEGPPKIQIGVAEFSEKEWENLLKKIDKFIDDYKEELRERIRKQNGESAKDQPAKSAVEAKSLAEVAGVAPDSEAQEEQPAVSETEAISGTQKNIQRGSSFLARLSSGKRAPYSYLADETGMIVYKGVVFACDDKKQQICLGDMSNPNKVLNIPLSKGGVLRVNRDNLDDLVKAIDMFSPEDITRILRAIAQDKKIREIELEIEEMSSEDPLKSAQGTS